MSHHLVCLLYPNISSPRFLSPASSSASSLPEIQQAGPDAEDEPRSERQSYPEVVETAMDDIYVSHKVGLSEIYGFGLPS